MSVDDVIDELRQCKKWLSCQMAFVLVGFRYDCPFTASIRDEFLHLVASL